MASRDTRLLIAALLLPHTEGADGQRWSLDQALDWADALTHREAERPVRQPRADAGQPRARRDFVAQLGAGQRAAFDRFWRAYQLKEGKQDAAGAWLAIDPSPAEAEAIIAAAARDARGAGKDGRTRADGTGRKYPQGWLTSRRWEDAEATAAADAAPGAAPSSGPRPGDLLLHRNGLRKMVVNLERMGLPVTEQVRAQLAAAEAAVEASS